MGAVPEVGASVVTVSPPAGGPRNPQARKSTIVQKLSHMYLEQKTPWTEARPHPPAVLPTLEDTPRDRAAGLSLKGRGMNTVAHSPPGLQRLSWISRLGCEV
jgi:hypothetical protein